MKLHEYERAGPNIAGLTSAVQQAEIRLLLEGRWPPLKPLPVFKLETAEYRAAIDFDKLRGEWVCRKTSLSSNKVQELRGTLTEIITALPRGDAEVLGECTAAERPERELEKDANRRREAMLAWRENCENGVLYAGLQGYLTQSQRDEIDDSIRLTLTARQLQVSPKNVAYVFDALSKAGGKLATLMESARQNKAEPEGGVPAKAKSAAAGAAGSSGASVFSGISGSSGGQGFVAVEPTHSTLDACAEGLTLESVENLIPAILESSPEEHFGSVLPEDKQHFLPGTAHAASPGWKTVTPEIVDTDAPRSLAEELRERGRRYAALSSLGVAIGAGSWSQSRAGKGGPAADRVENSPARSRVLEISGWQVAAAALLVALSTLAVVFAVGRGMMGERHPDSQKLMPTVAATSSAPLTDPSDPTSRSSTPPPDSTSPIPELNPPAPATARSPAEIPAAQPVNTRPRESIAPAEPVEPSSASSAMTTRVVTDSRGPEVSTVPEDANGPVARKALPPNAQPAPSARSAAPISSAAASTASRVRHVVGTEATSPKRARWSAKTRRSLMAVAPSAMATAMSTSTWPRS